MNIASMAKGVFLLRLIGPGPNTLESELDLHPPRACKSPKNVVSAVFKMAPLLLSIFFLLLFIFYSKMFHIINSNFRYN